MRPLIWAGGLILGAATAAQATACRDGVSCLLGAPAPVGAGVPVALAAGAVLCGTMLVKFLRRS